MNPVDPNEASQTVIPEPPETPVSNLWQRWRQEQCPDFSDAAVGGLSAEQALAVLRYDQCRRWQAGERVPAEKYLQTYSILKSDPDQALVLIYGEFLLRQQLGENPTLDEYLQRFPDCAELLREQDEFHRAVEGVSWLDPIAPNLPEQAGVCRVVGEIARGGMGMILKGHDQRLGRDLAVKVLRDEYRDRPEVVRRFLEEAQVSGQLQHPGIVPVHEVGQFDDGRPYFTMKLVQGQTLGSLLAERTPVGQDSNLPGVDQASWKLAPQDLPRFLKIFEQVCQTLAYAHSKGVIHRDLKPANVMVGAFGEVQVMDWGLAKQLQIADSRLQMDKDHETIGGGTWSNLQSPRTQLGQAVGTPAYMAPEQARGEGSILDERCDVFGLGALLCEILTGQPPYVGQRALEILDQAKRCDLDGALARLDGCGADAELLKLAKACLAPAPQDRPCDAGAVAEHVTAYLAGVQERLRRVEAEQAATQARAAEEAKTRAAEQGRRRTALALAAALVLLVVGAGAAWLTRSTERTLRRNYLNQEVGRALHEAAQKRAELHATLNDPQHVEQLLSDIDQWQARLQGIKACWEQAKALAESDRDLLNEDLAGQLEQLGSGLAADQKQWALAKELDDIRLEAHTLVDGQLDSGREAKKFAKVFEQVFAEADLSLGKNDAAVLAGSIARSPVRYALVAALDDWARATLNQNDNNLMARLLEVARKADPHPWRDRFRQVSVWNDLGELRQLAKELRSEEQSSQVIVALASQLHLKAGDKAALFRQALVHRPRDFWSDFCLGAFTKDPVSMALASQLLPKDSDEAAALLRQALVHHPRDFWLYFILGGYSKDPVERAACLRTAVAFRPKDVVAHYNFGNALFGNKDVNGAITEYCKAIHLHSRFAPAHYNLGIALLNNKEFKEAATEFDKAIQLGHDTARAHYNLGHALLELKNPDRAITELGKAIQRDPNYAPAHYLLGNAFVDKKDLDGAITEYGKAIQLDANSASFHYNLGNALLDKKDLDGAIRKYGRAIQLDAGHAPAHYNLGFALRLKNDVEGAIQELRKAIQLDAKIAEAHYSLGEALFTTGCQDEAVAALEEAIRLKPDYAKAHCGLGLARQTKGEFTEAVAALRRGHELGSQIPNWPYPSAQWLRSAERLVELDGKLPAILGGSVKPANAAECLGLAVLCRRYKRFHVVAARFYADAFTADPKLAADIRQQHRYSAACSTVLAGAGKAKDGGPLPDKDAVKLRRQALDWLRADLAVYAKLADGNDAAKQLARQRLVHWQTDADLVCVRDPKALDQLPEAERQAWRRLWADISAILQKTQPVKEGTK
jgi:tetratricopeptide (TPR) repeat protein/tRNA A-37 threonylcarbamoyl transferase component Bud32